MTELSETEITRMVTTVASKAAELAAEKAVQKTFLALGLDITTPRAVIDLQEDFAYWRRSRQLSGVIVKYGVITVVTTIVGASLTLAWLGFTSIFKHWP